VRAWQMQKLALPACLRGLAEALPVTREPACGMRAAGVGCVYVHGARHGSAAAR